jgi:hypothetical protein
LNEVATGKLSNDEFLKRSQARATGAGVGLFLVADGYFGFPITRTALKVGGIGGAFVVAGHIGELHTNGNISDPGERKARLEQTNKDLVFDGFSGFAGTQLFKFAGLTRSAASHLFSGYRLSNSYLLAPRSLGLRSESKLGFNVPKVTESMGSEDLNLPRLDSYSGVVRASKFGNQWESASQKEAIERFAPGAIGQKTASGKTLFLNEGTGIQVVADDFGNYFRIQNLNLGSRRCYLCKDGTVPNFKPVNGKLHGTTNDEYKILTHFNNADK